MAPAIRNLFSQHPVTAYPVNFDLAILSRYGINRASTWPCLMTACQNILKLPNRNGHPGYKFPKLDESFAYFFPSEELGVAHRAGADAIKEARIAYKLVELGVWKS